MKKYKIYLFDFDGTLLNTLPALQHVFEVSYAHIGFEFDPAWTLEFSRVPLHVSYAKIGAPKDKWDEFIAYIDYSLDLPKSLISNTPYPESLEFFQYLKDNNIFAGIVTSNNIKHVKEVFDILEIDSGIFKLFIGNKECQQFKPHPDPILKAIISIATLTTTGIYLLISFLTGAWHITWIIWIIYAIVIRIIELSYSLKGGNTNEE